MPDGPWTQYQSQPEQGPWMKYQSAPSQAPEITPLPPTPPPPSLYQRAGQAMQDFGTGSLKGLGNTVSGISSAIHAIPGIGPKIIPNEGLSAFKTITRPEGTAQKLGYGAEQAAEFLLPGPAEEKAGALAAEHLPSVAKIAAPAARIGVQALDTGLLNKAQGGTFKGGLAAGAGGGVAGEAMRAAAPALAESALGISKRMRGYGKTPGVAALEETRGIRPATIERTAGSRLGELTKNIEGMAQSHKGTVSLRPALNTIDREMQRAIRENDQAGYNQLHNIREALTTEFSTGSPIPRDVPAAQALDLKRGMRKQFISNWNPEVLSGTRATAARSSGAVDKELDSALGPDFAANNQRISSLIPVAERAESEGRNAGLLQNMRHRVAAHTGALTGAIGGGLYGYQKGGPEKAVEYGLAGIALPELIASPEAGMAAARTLHSPVTPRILKGAAVQIDRPSEEERDDENRY